VTSHDGPISLGTFDFQFTRDEINVYRKALGFPEGEEVPITFATRALTEPAALAELRTVCGDQIPIHIEQAFDVTEALNSEINYKVSLVLEVLRDSRMRLTGTFTSPSNGVCIVMRSEFLLVQLAALK
jgi:hypothetical protein